MDSSIWDKMSQDFPKEQCYFIDLGFTNNDNVAGIPCDGKSIFITHSLGTLWALKNHSDNMAGLIAINGFTNFTNFVSERTLRTMQRRLKRNPLNQMQEFWDICGFDNKSQEKLDQNFNIDKLHIGLEWLIDWDASKIFNGLNIPSLSLIGKKDRLLLPLMMEKEWPMTNIKTIKDGGHMLPLSHPKWCVEKIREFTSEYKLER